MNHESFSGTLLFQAAADYRVLGDFWEVMMCQIEKPWQNNETETYQKLILLTVSVGDQGNGFWMSLSWSSMGYTVKPLI